MPASIVVVGSLNMDFVAQVECLPLPGETVSRQRLPYDSRRQRREPGVRRRPSRRTRADGRACWRRCVRRAVAREPARPPASTCGPCTRQTRRRAASRSFWSTRAAGIRSSWRREANGRLTPLDVEAALGDADEGYLLLQLETPLETVAAAAAIGRRRGLTVILDRRPGAALPAEVLACIDILTPNESEALVLLGAARRGLAARGARGGARASRAGAPAA